MPRFLLAFLLLSPVEANQPSIDQMHSAYMGAGWYPAFGPRGEAVCIDKNLSLHADRVVLMIVKRAKGVSCS
jgi:hypothetical protein